MVAEHRTPVRTVVADLDLPELGGVLDAQGREWEGGSVTQMVPSPAVHYPPGRNPALQVKRLPFLCTFSSGVPISPRETHLRKTLLRMMEELVTRKRAAEIKLGSSFLSGIGHGH